MSQRDEIRQELETLASQYETLPRFTIDFAMGMIDKIAMQYSGEIFPEEDKNQLVTAIDRMMFQRNKDAGVEMKEALVNRIAKSRNLSSNYDNVIGSYQKLVDLVGVVGESKLPNIKQSALDTMQRVDEARENEELMDSYLEFVELQFPGLARYRLTAISALQEEEEAYSRLSGTINTLLERIQEREGSPQN